jgi:hypothetical protein
VGGKEVRKKAAIEPYALWTQRGRDTKRRINRERRRKVKL